MKRIIAVSDVHGFYNEMMKALNEVNFNPETDLFVSCGDAMDRGPKPREVIKFMNRLPNKVLVKGNHEQLMQDAIQRKYFLSHDFHNRTADTAYDFCTKENAGVMNHAQILGELRDDPEYQKYINSLVNYYETEHYVFVHSAIPAGDSWREADIQEWEDARWPNPFNEVLVYDNYPKDKILVFGHWHTSWMWAKEGKKNCFDIYRGDKFIGIDACTVLSGKVNVLVVEDNLI